MVRDSEFSSYKIELRNQVAQNDTSLRVTDSQTSYETKLRKMTSHFELLTHKPLEKLFFRVTDSTS